jgi:phage terminase small subunit
LKNPTKPPKHLEAESAALWAELITEYAINDPAGLAILGQACEALDRVRSAQDAIGDDVVVYDRFHQPKPHPAVAVERDARSAFLAALRALNLDLEPLRDRPGRPPGGG